MSNPKNPDNLPEERLEEIVERVKEEVEEIVHEQEVLGDPNRPSDYDPEFTREVLELDMEDRLDAASAIAKKHDVENEFDDLLKQEGTEQLSVPDIARLVDEAVLAKPLEKKPSLWQRTKAWYHRCGPRFKYNAEICSGAAVGLPLSMAGGGLFDWVYSQFPAVQRLRDITVPVSEYIPWFDDLDGLSALVAGSTVALAGAASWMTWKYIRDRNQKSVYADYPEIKRRDYGWYIGALMGVGLIDSAIRIYSMSWLDQSGYDPWLAAGLSILPATLVSLSLMNLLGKPLGLIRDDEKLAKAMIHVEKKRFKDEEDI